MALVTWKQHIAPVGGTTTAVTGSWTPTSAGNQGVGFGFDGAASAFTGITGTGTYVAPNTMLVPAPNTGFKVATNMSLTAGAQTTTFTTATGDQVVGFLEEYANVNAVMFQQTTIASPGNSTAFGNVSVPVPTGGVVVAVCIDFSGSGTNTITNTNGTSRGSGINLTGGYAWRVSELAGPGYLTPQFSVAAGGTDTFKILYAVLLPSGVLQPLQANRGTEGNFPNLTVALTSAHIQVGDLIFMNYGGSTNSTTMLPLTVSDNVNTGNYIAVSAGHFDSTAQFGNQHFYKIANVDAPSGVTITANTGGPGTVGGFIGALHMTGFQGTPTVDTVTYSKDDTGASTTQTGNFTTNQPLEVLLCSPWNSSTTLGSNNWIPMNVAGTANTDSMYWAFFYNNQGANNFSAALTAASNWTTEIAGIFDQAPTPPVLLGQICL